MKNIIYILLFLFNGLIANAQANDLSKKFKSYHWKTELKWFNSDTLTLITIKKKDSMWTSLNVEEKLKKKNQIWTERISFDSIGNLKYQDNRFCGLSDYRKLNRIEIIDNKLIVDFVFQKHNSPKEIETNKSFEIKNLTENRILLIAYELKN